MSVIKNIKRDVVEPYESVDSVAVVITNNSFSIKNNSSHNVLSLKMDYKGQFDSNFSFGYVPVVFKKKMRIVFTNLVDSETIFTYTGSVKFSNIRITMTETLQEQSPVNLDYQEDKWERTRSNFNETTLQWEDADSELVGNYKQGISSVTFKDLKSTAEIKLTSEFPSMVHRIITRDKVAKNVGALLRKRYPVDFDKRFDEYLVSNKNFKNYNGDK